MKRWLACCLIAVAVFAADKARPGWLGLGFTHHGEGDEQWLVIRAIVPRSPAAAAQLAEGDVVVAINGKPIRFQNTLALLEMLGKVKPGQRVTFTVIHRQKTLKRSLVAVPMTDEQFERWQMNLQIARRAASTPGS